MVSKEEDVDNKIGCSHCSVPRRVINTSQLQAGQHITEQGQNKLKYNENTHELKKQYFHHAIIVKILNRTDYEVEFELIHYTEVTGVKQGKVKRTKEHRDLKHDELYIVEYKYAKYEPEEIIRRAESEVKKEEPDVKTQKYKDKTQKQNDQRSRKKPEDPPEPVERNFAKYHLLKSNCEHFATWCVVDKRDCFQLERKTEFLIYIKSALLGVTHSSKLTLMILSTLDFKKKVCTILKCTHIPIYCLAPLALFYLAYSVYKLVQIYRAKKRAEICIHCYKQKRSIWITELISFLASGGLVYLLIHFGFPLLATCIGIPCIAVVAVLIGIPIAAALIAVPVALQASGIRWLYKSLSAPFECRSIKVEALSDTGPGDVIIFRYYGPRHYAVVTEITRNQDHPQGLIRFVHYNARPITRVIIEDEIPWSEKKTVHKLDLGLMTISSKEIVSRARSRIGEKKWHPFKNRSDHFCFWAVNKRQDWKYYIPGENKEETSNKITSEQKLPSTLLVECVNVHLREEIQTGDIVEFRVKTGKHKKGKGVITDIQVSEKAREQRAFQLTIVMETKTTALTPIIYIPVDLDTDTLKVQKFHPVHCYTMEERKDRAIKYSTTDKKDKKVKLTEYCVMKKE